MDMKMYSELPYNEQKFWFFIWNWIGYTEAALFGTRTKREG